MRIKSCFFCWMCLLVSLNVCSQELEDTRFKGNIYNDELKICIVMNLVEKNVVVPQQDIFGEVDGYMSCKNTAHAWVIVSSEIKGKTAHIQLINNYGSEDLSATLTLEKDGTYTFNHVSGSTLKFPVGQKWHKIPKKVVFKRK